MDGKKGFTVPNSLIPTINDLETSDSLQHPKKTNMKAMFEIISKFKLNRLWDIPDLDFSDDERLFFY